MPIFLPSYKPAVTRARRRVVAACTRVSPPSWQRSTDSSSALPKRPPPHHRVAVSAALLLLDAALPTPLGTARSAPPPSLDTSPRFGAILPRWPLLRRTLRLPSSSLASRMLSACAHCGPPHTCKRAARRPCPSAASYPPTLLKASLH